MNAFINRRRLRQYVQLRDAIRRNLRLLKMPGFQGLPLYDVLVFFFKGLFKGALSIRASAVAFNFFLAIFPFILFLFTLIPYIPIENFQLQLFDFLAQIIPPDTFEMVEQTIFEIVMKQNTGLLSLSFVLTFVFSTNGTNAIIEGFNSTWHQMPAKGWFHQRLMAAFLMVILLFLVVISVVLLTLGGSIISYLVTHGWIKGVVTVILLNFMKWLISLTLIFFSVSFLYYYAPAKRKAFRFFSPGSILATTLFVAGLLGFNFYINNFSRYNALYGSIGTLIIFLLWLFLNAFILLIGFELNASIMQASQEQNAGIAELNKHAHR